MKYAGYWFACLPEDLRREAEEELQKLEAVQPFLDGFSRLQAGEKLMTDRPDGHCAIRSLDTPLVDKGFYFNLYNNQRNTNLTCWYEDDAVFRFEPEL